MRNENNVSVQVGPGFFGLLALLFITLKLVGVSQVQHWSWIWVLSPIWGPMAFFLSLALVFLLIGFAAAILESIFKR